MFVLELSKPSSICLAAVQRDEAAPRGWPGYLICARYADVWHVMNIAVDPALRRRGIAAALMERLIEQAGTDAAYTLEVRPSNAPAIALYERLGFRSAGHAAALLPRHRRGRADHVARSRTPSQRTETSG